MGDVRIVAQSGSHVLLERDGRLAILERRNGLVFAVAPAGREGFPDTAEGRMAAVGEGWGEEAEMRARFRDITERGEALARKIW